MQQLETAKLVREAVVVSKMEAGPEKDAKTAELTARAKAMDQSQFKEQEHEEMPDGPEKEDLQKAVEEKEKDLDQKKQEVAEQKQELDNAEEAQEEAAQDERDQEEPPANSEQQPAEEEPTEEEPAVPKASEVEAEEAEIEAMPEGPEKRKAMQQLETAKLVREAVVVSK